MESNTLKKLVEEAKTGSREAFDELVRLTYPRLLKRAVSVTGNLEDARDAVQEAYMRAFRSLATLKGDASFSQWMHTIVNNASATLAAKGRRRRFEVINNASHSRHIAVELDEEKERDPGLLVEIQRAVEQLPEQLRRVFVLRSYGLEHREIAARLGISESNAKVRLHRARVLLRAKLGPQGRTHSEAG